MILTYQAAEGQPPYRIDAGALNNELAAALGGWCNGWSASHNASQAIVMIEDESLADKVKAVVEAHVANTDTREHNKAIDAEIAKIEVTVTQRMLRERGQRLIDADTKIALLRKQRK